MSRGTPPEKPKHPLLAGLRDRLTKLKPWRSSYPGEFPTWDADQKHRRSQLREEFAGYTLAEIDAAITQQRDYMLEANFEADRAKELYHDMLAIKRGF